MGDRQVRRGDSIPNPGGGNGTSAHHFVSSQETVTPPQGVGHDESGSLDETFNGDPLIAGGCGNDAETVYDCARAFALSVVGVLCVLAGCAIGGMCR
jgi:hypothetical protein